LRFSNQKCGVHLTRTWTAVQLLALCFVPLLAIAFTPARASSENASFDVDIDHIVEIRDGGMLVINDTVRLSTKPEETVEPFAGYLLGFPYGYQTSFTYAFAYETSNPSSRLTLELNVGMGRVGLFGVSVVFPQAVDISNGRQYEFTVVFVFSSSITSGVHQADQKVMYNASFPAYPSLTDEASEAKVTIVSPDGLDYLSSSYEMQGANFTKTVSGSKQYFSFVKGNLSEFSDVGGWFATVKSTGSLEILEFDEVKRTIELSGLEQIIVADTYTMTSKSDSLKKIVVKLPKGAFDITVSTLAWYVPSGNLNLNQTSTYTALSIAFPTPFAKAEKVRFAVNYQLPWEDYVSTENWKKFKTSLTLLESPDWTIKNLIVNVNLPEGAVLVTAPSVGGLNSIQNGAFSSSLVFFFENVTSFHDLSLGLEYERAVFWDSFRPTLWMGSLVAVVAVVAVIWSSYKPAVAPLPTGILPVRVEDLKGFIDSYDEKRRLQREIESLEAQVNKGKIPRRRYRVRKLTIESRLSSLSRDLAALRAKINAAGPRYADLMRQLEVAEAEQQGVIADINRTEIRYRRGEISAAAYHKLLEDYYRRRDRAKTTIDGVLLRLREELS